MSKATTTPLHAIPILRRPASPWSRKFATLLFIIVFSTGCLMVNATQFLIRLLPLASLRSRGMRGTKGAFGCLLVLMVQWFAPTTMSLTFETEGKGAFTQQEIDQFVGLDSSGKHAVSLNLPQHFVLISNHQVYLDWWYAWCFLHVGNMGSRVYITLKNTLKWIPVVGWGMQFFNFIFLARSWASDKLQLASALAALVKEDGPLAFIIYPEGTLVSNMTRPISKKFAEKMGIPDLTNSLLPRSTGLHYCLRSLSPRIKNLHLLDLTIIYPGIPEAGYGQSYYTLRSVFFDGVPPPEIHIHLRMFKVDEVPIGNPSIGHEVVDIPDAERAAFEFWLRALWQDKDDSITRFHREGTFGTSPQEAVKIPLRLHRAV